MLSNSAVNRTIILEDKRSGARVFRVLIQCVMLTVITGLSARVRFYMPFTPVPVTGQVFGVLLSGLMLGSLGSMSQLLYLVLGLSGVNWFVVGPIGPTGGYLVGFLLAPLVIGWIRRATGRTAPALAAGIAAIYLPGMIQFMAFTGASIRETVRLSVLPFVPFDLGKAFLAAVSARVLTGRFAHRD
jgi:biotin transport system substrate-specific component